MTAGLTDQTFTPAAPSDGEERIFRPYVLELAPGETREIIVDRIPERWTIYLPNSPSFAAARVWPGGGPLPDAAFIVVGGSALTVPATGQTLTVRNETTAALLVVAVALRGVDFAPAVPDATRAYERVTLVTPDDTADLPFPTRGISFGTAGALRVRTVAGDDVTIPSGALARSEIHPLAVTRVYATGTSAADIVAYA